MLASIMTECHLFVEVGCAADTHGVPEVTQGYLRQPANIVNLPLAANRIIL
jgi:hypothetical protein